MTSAVCVQSNFKEPRAYAENIRRTNPRPSCGILRGMKTEALVAADDNALRRRAEETGDRLRSAVDSLLTELGRRGLRDQRSMQGALKLSQSAISRLVSSVRSGDSLATLSSIPGPEALRQMVKGASQSGVDRDCIERVESAVAGLQDFLDSEIGDRTTLDAVLSDWVHESRGAFELRHKAAAFKSMSALRGVQAEMILNAGIVYPSAGNADAHDCIGIDALLGCKRIRPSGTLRLFGSYLAPEGASFTVSSLQGAAIGSMQDMLLPEFSTVPPEHIETQHHGQYLETTIRELPLGKGADRGEDLVCAQLYRGVHRARRGAGAPSSGVGGQAEPPSGYYVVDALLHDDVWPGVQPELRLFDTVVRGITHPDNATRLGDRLDMLESVHSLGRGPEAFRLPEFPAYPEIIRQTCAQVGWDPRRLRGFRCKVRYPIYGSQIGLAFSLPT